MIRNGARHRQPGQRRAPLLAHSRSGMAERPAPVAARSPALEQTQNGDTPKPRCVPAWCTAEQYGAPFNTRDLTCSVGVSRCRTGCRR
ncbi:hypothetical protein ACU4GD_35005 [Cupriavidus basilensis]